MPLSDSNPATRVEAQLLRAWAAEQQGHLELVRAHLGLAHALAQPHPSEHRRVHARMLGFAWRQRDLRMFFAQLVPWVVAVLRPGSGMRLPETASTPQPMR